MALMREKELQKRRAFCGQVDPDVKGALLFVWIVGVIRSAGDRVSPGNVSILADL